MSIVFISLFFLILIFVTIIGILIFLRLRKKDKAIVVNILPKCPLNGNEMVIPCFRRGYCYLPNKSEMYSTVCNPDTDDCGNGIGNQAGKKAVIINGKKMWFKQINYDPKCKSIDPNSQGEILMEINKK